MKPKAGFFGKSNNIDFKKQNPSKIELGRKERKGKNNVRQDKETSQQSSPSLKIIRRYYEQCHAFTFENLDKWVSS